VETRDVDTLRTDPMSARAPRAGWMPTWLSEALILKSVFWSLLAGAVAVAALDFSELYQRADADLPGDHTQRNPVVMEPPRRHDHVRTYLPRAMPKRPKGGGPQMPGYGKPPADTAVGERMQFVRGPKGAASAVGRIEPGTADDLARFLEQQGGEVKMLYLHSPGGYVDDALRMSLLLRDKGLDTKVPNDGYCASSCPIVFAGGKNRSAGARAWVGVHQVFVAQGSDGDINDGMAGVQTITARVQDHLVAMGVDPRAWIPAMKTPSDQIYIFTPEELTEYKLATVDR
jgi:ATP-dependent protease ClpP protease subunit